MLRAEDIMRGKRSRWSLPTWLFGGAAIVGANIYVGVRFFNERCLEAGLADAAILIIAPGVYLAAMLAILIYKE